MMKTMKLTP
jgi:hypothetical protein